MRSIAFYLPQFHPIPENDAWWGKGFTEWTNVAKAKPLFPGHDQPQLPSDLGFYDLRLPEAREEQAILARAGAVDAFCYWHYWFQGRRILERPFEEVLGSGKPDFPFCLCWANESWSRRWDGSESEVLLNQSYSLEDFENHAEYLIRAFRDPRYVKVDGKPLMLVYRASVVPLASECARIWRQKVEEAGFPGLHLCRVESFPQELASPLDIGFDASVEFAPGSAHSYPMELKTKFKRRLARRGLINDAFLKHRIHSYDDVVRQFLDRPESREWTRYPCVSPGWDNSPRKKAMASIFLGSTPEKYRDWVKRTVAKSIHRGDADLLFVNAWNEWAEGNHMEPCQKWGRSYLEAHRAGVDEGLSLR